MTGVATAVPVAVGPVGAAAGRINHNKHKRLLHTGKTQNRIDIMYLTRVALPWQQREPPRLCLPILLRIERHWERPLL